MNVTGLGAVCALLLAMVATSVDCESPACRLEDCPNYRAIRHYEELGCERSDGSSQCCPTRYDCSSFLSLEKTKCHYRGKAYEPGTQIQEEIISGCTPPCTCVVDPDSTFRGEAEFDCGYVDCLEYFESEPEPGCFRTYNVNLCCSTGVHCENATEGRQDLAECVYKGKRYLEGQYIEVPDPDCLTCVCQEGFNGTLEGPWCKKFSCDYTLGQRLSELASCAPVFWNTSNCCPISWHCPSPEDTLVGRSEPTAENVSENKECDPDKCPNYAMLRYYRELTCHPYNNSDACCPTVFDCSFLDAIDNKKCQYKGIVYDVGTILYDEIEDPCAAECRCTETLKGTGFECTEVVCPEKEIYGQLRPNCFLKFDATHCCSTGVYCLPDGNEEGLETEPTMKCFYNGYEHVEGQYLSVEYPLCLVCACEQGFDGTLNGPWCHKYTCDLMVQFKVADIKECAPVFSNEYSCCALMLHCPIGTDYVLEGSSNLPTAAEMHCTFGRLKLKKGDHLVSPGVCLKCRCEVPPFVTCYMYLYDGCKYPGEKAFIWRENGR